MRITLTERGPQTWPVGLDGVYRLSEGEYGLPLGMRGHWEGGQAFVAEYHSIANNDDIFLRMRITQYGVCKDAQETTHEDGLHDDQRRQQGTR